GGSHPPGRPQPDRLRKNTVTITASRRPTTNTSLGCGQPFDRRTLLRGAGALGAASLALASTACSSDDDALTFFFAANPEEADARLRVVDAFQRRHPDIKVRTLLSGPDAAQNVSIYGSGGKCPDFLMAWEFTYAGLPDRGVLPELNTMLAYDKTFAYQLRADNV